MRTKERSFTSSRQGNGCLGKYIVVTFGFVARRLMVKCLSRGRSWWVEFGILKGSRIEKNLEIVEGVEGV